MNSTKEVCYKLSTINNEYLARHHFEMPESIIELQKFVTKEGQKYRGWAAIGIWS